MKKVFAVLLLAGFCGLAFAQDESTKKYSLVTDLGDSSAGVKCIEMLLDKLNVYSPAAVKADEILARKDGLVVLVSDERKISGLKDLVNKYTEAGGTIVMDIKDFAELNGYQLKSAKSSRVKVKEESVITSGYKKDEAVYYSYKGKLNGLSSIKKEDGVKVLGEGDDGTILLVEQKKLLFTRLDAIIKEYDILVESFVNNETFGIYIKNFKMFNVFLGELKKSESAFDSKFFEIYDFIQDIRTEYKH